MPLTGDWGRRENRIPVEEMKAEKKRGNKEPGDSVL